MFGELGNLWSFVIDETRKRTSSRATNKEDSVGALLTMYHTCRYTGDADNYFNKEPPTMQQYRAMYLIWAEGVEGEMIGGGQ